MRIAVLILLAGILAASAANAAIPLQVNYQGRVSVGGVPFNGNGLFRFTLADRTTSVTLWCNDASRNGQPASSTPTRAVNLPVINGIFNVRLGDAAVPNMRALPSTVFNTDRVVLRVWFDDQTNGNRLLLPDQPIASVAYAFHALSAETATSANTATTAGRATTATIALNSNGLGGLTGASYQRRVTGIAPSGQVIRAINANGSVVVGTSVALAQDSNRLAGLAGAGYQRRVIGVAPTNQFIRAINPDGSVVVGTTVTFAQNTAHASNADQATTSTFAFGAGQATTATFAGVAGQATTSTFAFDAGALAGSPPTAFQRRVFGAAGPGEFIRAINPDGSVVTGLDLVSSGSAGGWDIGGNSNVTSGTHFLGTITTSPVDLRVNNTRALRLEYGSQSPNFIAGHNGNSIATGVFGAAIGGGGNAANPNRVNRMYGTVGGGIKNQTGSTTGGIYATIGGGSNNLAIGNYSTIAGGYTNMAGELYATVGGGAANRATTQSATVGGGDTNFATGQWSTVPGGNRNTAQGIYSLAAGNRARALHPGTFVWGDSAPADFASTDMDQFLIRAGGGVGINTNIPTGFGLRVGGPVGFEEPLDMAPDGSLAPILNVADPTTTQGAATKGYVDNAVRAAPPAWQLDGNAGITPGVHFLGTVDDRVLELRVAGTPALHLHPTIGSPNLIGGSSSNIFAPGAQGAAIGGGGDIGAPNRATDSFGTISGGADNQVGNGDAMTTNAIYATVGGGLSNVASDLHATVGGGLRNSANGRRSTVGGGENNATLQEWATVSGGSGNTATGLASMVGGGDMNVAGGLEATIGGGGSNTADGAGATVGGGWINHADGPQSTIAGGYWNVAMADNATVGGGYRNSASTISATIAGGESNTASGLKATVGGGLLNQALGRGATVPGGAENTAAGDYSFAAGQKAEALHSGTFVWNTAGESVFGSTANNQFLINAPGGVGINTNTPGFYALRVMGNAGIDGQLDMGPGGSNAEIIHLADPTTSGSAATKFYVDNAIAGAMMPDYITGCELEWVDSSTIRVQPGALELAGALLKNGLASPNVDVATSTSWLNGSEGQNMWIYVYLSAGGPVWQVGLSDQPPDSNDTQSHPSGILRYRNYAGIWYRCIGAVRNDGAGNLVKFYQNGNMIVYDDALLNVVLAGGAAISWTDVDCSTYVPGKLSSLVGLVWEASGDTDYYLRKNGSTAPNGIRINPDAGETGTVEFVPVDPAAILEYRVTANALSLYIKGYCLNVR